MTDDSPLTLESFRAPLHALVFGASGGIGAACVDLLAPHPCVAAVYAASRTATAPWNFSLEDEGSIAGVAAAAAAAAGPLDLVIVATGVLHAENLLPEKTWRSMDAAALARAFAVNATGPALIAKHTLGLLRRDAKSVFACLSARVGSIEDNRLGGWHAYRASKAALNMLVRSCAVELRQRNAGALCVALHPGTVDTRLSKPFQAGVEPAKLLTPQRSARALLRVLDRLTPADSGRLWAWDGRSIPF
ncbi:MAG: SDR family NAD(P)-dependent oxidoreductase [Gammaproteobacteria bacterium]|nr:SDR family NAD(P)-dependent oxidoreductase [Gammaproteobacteria bacterium]